MPDLEEERVADLARAYLAGRRAGIIEALDALEKSHAFTTIQGTRAAQRLRASIPSDMVQPPEPEEHP